MRLSAALTLVTIAVTATWAFAQGRAKDQDPDMPKIPGTCALYYTHQHERGKSWQLTCSDPIPAVAELHLLDSLRVDSVRTWREP